MIHDLASGMTCEQVAKKYGRAHQTVKENSARWAPQIAQERAALAEGLTAELRGLWITNKDRAAEWLQEYAEDCEAELVTEDDKRERRQLRSQAAKLIRQAMEMTGQIPQRMSVDVGGQEHPKHILIGVNIDEAFPYPDDFVPNFQGRSQSDSDPDEPAPEPADVHDEPAAPASDQREQAVREPVLK